MAQRIRGPIIGLALAVVLCFSPVRAQVQLGSETLVNLDGSATVGYSGSTTNEGPNSHGVDFGGSGNFSGSYYSPQFLNFNVGPFFNQSRNNSGYQSITDSSGVTANANIFGGSHFPGYVNFSKIFNSESTYSLPGLGNYSTNGDSQTLGVGWSANLNNLPSLSFGYQQGSSDYSLYGTKQDNLSHFDSIFGNSHYTLDGFHLSGGIRHSSTNSEFPNIVAGQLPEKAASDSTTYTFQMARSVPLDGSTWINFTRNTSGYDSLTLNNSQTSDIVNAGASLRPWARLTAQLNADYDDNLAGTIFQTVNATGAIVPVSFPESPSHSWGLFGGAQYNVISGLFLSGGISHRQQQFLGSAFNSTAISGSLNYGHNLLGGHFTGTATVNRNSYGNNGGSMVGFLTNAIYIRTVGTWNFSASFGYSRNLQTLLIAYTSSGYSYSGSANRRIGRLNWNGSAGGSRSLLSQAQGTSNFTQAYSTGLSGRWLGASFGYSKSSGFGLFTPAGITPLPPGVPATFEPTAILYSGRTYSVGLGSTPMPRLTISASYVNSRSSTENGSLSSNNKTEQAYAYLRYRFRKVSFYAGYSHILQGFSASGLIPATVSTYYVGVSRWFKAF